MIDYKQSFNYLSKYKAIKFIKENYEVEHTLSIEDAIEDMAIVARNNGGNPKITVFEFNEEIYNSDKVNVKKFESPTEEWALFVLNNRDRKYNYISSLKCNIDNKYDMVVGTVADDDLALLFRTFTKGLIDIDTLVKEMKYKKFSNQYSFHSEEALNFLKVIEEKEQ